MNIIGHKYIFLIASGIMVLSGIGAIAVWGLKPGIDFTGGSLLEVSFREARPPSDTIRERLGLSGVEIANVQLAGERNAIIRFRDTDEPTHQKVMHALGVFSGVKEERFDAIGPTIGAELKQNSFVAIGLAMAAIVLYIAWAFRRVSKPLPSWKYGVVAIATLVHDVAIPAGLFAALGHFRGVEVDTLFITALLTILGFSVHDTIVVFDRTRENLRNLKKSEPFSSTVNRSVNETLVRSLFTSLTVLIVLLAIFLLGGVPTAYFALALMTGVVFGTYSSIFVASPLLVIWEAWSHGR